MLTKQHSRLESKYSFYRNWHASRLAGPVHWAVMFIFLILAVGGSYYLTFYQKEEQPAVAANLEVPRIVSPFDGNISKSKRPLIRWTTVSGANAYRLKLYQDDTLLREKIVTQTEYTPDFDLADKGNYYWTVQALVTGASSYSNSNERKVAALLPQAQAARRKPATIPAIPTALLPGEGQTYKTGDIIFDWSDVTNNYPPVRYYLQISSSNTTTNDGSYQTNILNSGALSASTYTYTGLNPGTYYWHVRSVNNAGQLSNWSASRSFVVEVAGTTPPDPVPTPPALTDPTPTILSQSIYSPTWNFSIDVARSADFLMPDPSKRWIGAAPNSAIADFEAKTGTKHQVINGFKSFHWVANFPSSEVLGYYNSGHHYVLTWEPWNPSAGAQQTQYANTAMTTNGSFVNSSGTTLKFDEYYTRYAQQIKAYKKPVYLRFAHEMNGNWYPWGNVSGNTPSTYVAMWRHVHDVFEANGVKNVRWLWNANNEPISSLSPYYPGDTYVDVASLDGYNWGTTKTWSSWQEFTTLYAQPVTTLSSITKRDIWIVEVGSVEAGGSKANWITSAYAYARNNLARVRNVMWFNSDVWAVDTTTTALNAYKAAVQSFLAN